MEEFGTFLTGIFSRPERLIEATRKRDPDLEKLVEREERKIIKLQRQYGLTYCSDPLLDWDDMLRPLTDGLPGLVRGPLNRIFENNTFYRIPMVEEKLDRRPKGNGGLISRHLHSNLLGKSKKKVDIPDPFTITDLSEDRCYGDKVELMFDIARVLSREVGTLVKSGFSLIQLNAPSIAYHNPQRDQLNHIGDAINEIVKHATGAKVYLHLYWGDISKIFPMLLDLNIDGIGVDFTHTSLESVKGHSVDMGLACGCLDAQNTRMEDPKSVADFATNVIDELSPRAFFLTNSCDLEYIPYQFALRKLANMAKASFILKGR
ncbi:MAG: hypothetical protein ACE5KG_00445 [Nitrososphaerales archaeon]